MTTEADTTQGVSGEPATESSEVNWGDMAVDTDDDGGAYVIEPEVVVEPLAADPSTTPATVTPPAVEQTPPAIPPQQVAQPQVQQPQQPQQPVDQQIQQPVKTPEQTRQDYLALLSGNYAISEDDAVALATQPETVMPRLAANLHVNIMQEVVQLVQQALQGVPRMMQAQLQQSQAEQSAKQEFYGVWPGLEAHHESVLQNALLVRRAHPQATKQQVIDMAGTMTAMALGLDPASVRKAAQTPQTQPQGQQVQRPVRPAAPGPAPQGLPQQSENIFSQFADDDIDFLRG